MVETKFEITLEDSLVQVEGLLKNQELENVLVDEATRSQYYVLTKKNGEDFWDSGKLYVGSDSQQKQAEITDFDMLRDGGTKLLHFNYDSKPYFMKLPIQTNDKPFVEFSGKTVNLVNLPYK